MPARTQPREMGNVIGTLADRVRALEDAAKRRMLPAGYEFRIGAGGALIVRRLSDGSEQVVVFGE